VLEVCLSGSIILNDSFSMLNDEIIAILLLHCTVEGEHSQEHGATLTLVCTWGAFWYEGVV
jgi:hypothetical protein